MHARNMAGGRGLMKDTTNEKFPKMVESDG